MHRLKEKLDLFRALNYHLLHLDELQSNADIAPGDPYCSFALTEKFNIAIEQFSLHCMRV